MILHLTALETPIVWLVFAIGVCLGAAGTWLVMQRRSPSRG